MLKKPYIKFYSRDYNNYYLLTVNETYYLAIESVLHFSGGLFNRNKELQQGLKLMPLYSPILLTMTDLIKQEKIDEKEIEGLGKEEIFNTIDIKEIRDKIASMTDEVHDESQFNFKKTVKAPVIRKIMEESDFKYLMKIKLDSFKSNYWITKSDKYGKLTFHEATTGGRDEEKLMILNSYFLDRELVSEILIAIQKESVRQANMKIKNMKKQLKIMRKQNKEENKEEIKND